MSDNVEQINYENTLFNRAAGTLKVHGIVAIVFGSIGTLAGLLFTLLIALSTFSDTSYDTTNSPLGLFVMAVAVFVFWTLPHIYLIAAGVYLTRKPTPGLARTLVIINLVVGICWNVILLIFAIISLTQISDYERGYPAIKK